jgi:hypothetical protein
MTRYATLVLADRIHEYQVRSVARTQQPETRMKIGRSNTRVLAAHD